MIDNYGYRSDYSETTAAILHVDIFRLVNLAQTKLDIQLINRDTLWRVLFFSTRTKLAPWIVRLWLEVGLDARGTRLTRETRGASCPRCKFPPFLVSFEGEERTSGVSNSLLRSRIEIDRNWEACLGENKKSWILKLVESLPLITVFWLFNYSWKEAWLVNLFTNRCCALLLIGDYGIGNLNPLSSWIAKSWIFELLHLANIFFDF